MFISKPTWHTAQATWHTAQPTWHTAHPTWHTAKPTWHTAKPTRHTAKHTRHTAKHTRHTGNTRQTHRKSRGSAYEYSTVSTCSTYSNILFQRRSCSIEHALQPVLAVSRLRHWRLKLGAWEVNRSNALCSRVNLRLNAAPERRASVSVSLPASVLPFTEAI